MLKIVKNKEKNINIDIKKQKKHSWNIKRLKHRGSMVLYSILAQHIFPIINTMCTNTMVHAQILHVELVMIFNDSVLTSDWDI